MISDIDITMEEQKLLTEKIYSKRKFGYVEGELRGTDEKKLMNPPIELDDYYHWIRDDARTNPKVLELIKKENEHTDKIMCSYKNLTQTIYNETKSYIRESYDTYGYYLNLNDNWKYFRRFYEKKDYPSYWRKKTLMDGKILEEELLDINILAEVKSQCDVTSFEINPSHKYFSYGVDWDGSELYKFVLVDIETKQEISTPIPKLAYCSYFWAGPELLYYFVGDKSNRIYQLWLYSLKTQVNELVFEETNEDYNLDGGLTSDEKYVVVSSGNYDSNWSKIINLESSTTVLIDFLPELEKVKYGIEHHEGTWFIHTNKDATNWQVLSTSLNTLISWDNLNQFIPPNQVVNISSFCVYEKFLTFKTKVNGNSYLNIMDYDRTNVKVLTHLENKIFKFDDYVRQDFSNIKSELVYNISSGINTIYSTDKLNVMFSSMVSPSKLFDYNINTLEYEQVHEHIVPNYSQELYESKRIWVGQEGTRLGIPVSIVYRKDLFKSNKTNPLYLYGYGSYGITVNPDFDYEILPLLDRGYVYAIAHVRGGGFLGYDWYEDGKMNKKLNTFNDFIRCAEFFKESGLIDPNKIVIEGRSAGGLLIGASITMRPDLFWIGIPGVPFVDVLNTMSDSTIPLTKEEWTQWGNPNELESFEYMKLYCPYTNVRETSYPNLYCSAGLHDPRVPYWEIIKLVSKIREYKTDSNVQVIRVETSQGHFGGSSRYKSIEELAEKYAFIFTR
jgi:oligopeptidase B